MAHLFHELVEENCPHNKPSSMKRDKVSGLVQPPNVQVPSRLMESLQRSAGNRAVAHLVAQRCGAVSCDCPPEKRAMVESYLSVSRASENDQESAVVDLQDTGVLDIDTLVRTLAPFIPDLEPESDQAQVQTTVQRHTKADCDEQYDQCSDRCRQLPPNDKRRRALCWASCMAAYAACLATADETLTTAAIIAAIVLAASDGPLPIGDAAAVALLLAVRARVGS